MANGGALLTYSLATSPWPVQVSPSLADPSTATFTIVVSCPRDIPAVTVAQIWIRLPVSDPARPNPTRRHPRL